MSVAVGVNEDLARLAVEGKVKKNVLVDAVVVKEIVWTELIEPDGFTRIGIASEHTRSPFVLARALFCVPRSRIGCAVEDQVGFGIVRDPSPDGAPADLPRIRRPALFAEVLAAILRVKRLELRPDQDIFVWAGAVCAPDDLAGIFVER